MSDSTLTLILSGEELDKRAINAQTEALRRMLEKELQDGEVLAVEPAEVVPGAKGDPITIGTIVLALITSGSVVALINCFRGIFARERSLTISVKAPDGREVKINSKNINDESLLKRLHILFGTGEPGQV